MGFVGDIVGDIFGISDAAETSSDAAIQASEIEAESQQEALDYLKEINELPQDLKEQALTKLAGIYGLEGGVGSQQELIDQSISSPLYQSIMSGLDTGEEEILRYASATGGLRSGDTSYNLADYATQLQNSALLESYNQQLLGLEGLAGLSTGETEIANLVTDIGETLASGITAAAQSEQEGTDTTLETLLGLGQLGISAYSAGMFSDRRLKKNIKKIGEINGFNFYSFDWNIVANKLGLSGSTCGVMADEVFKKIPYSVILKDGFMFVLYDLLGIFPAMESV